MTTLIEPRSEIVDNNHGLSVDLGKNEVVQSNNKKDREDDHDTLLAAVLIQDAAAGRNMDFKSDENSIRSYVLFNHLGFKISLYVCLWGNIFVTFFENPAVWPLPYWATMIPEVFFLVYFSVRLGHASCFQEKTRFWRDPKNLTVFFTIVLTVIDMVVFCIVLHFSSHHMIRFSRPLRILLLINFPEGRQLRKAFRNIRRTLPDIIHVLILFFASIALFALLALKLFQGRNLHYPNGTPYFQDYWDGFWNLYVLVTTANNPDVKMPSYDFNSWYALFFILYLCINLYVFMNIVLAVIYNNYKKHLKNEVKAMIHQKHLLLTRAFDLLKTSQGDTEVITKDTWDTVMAIATPKKSRMQLKLLLSVLDTKGQNKIEKQDFLKVADLLNIHLKVVKDQGSGFDRCCPPCYVSKASEMLKTAIRTIYFQWAFDVLILANAICIGLNLEETEWFFLAIFTVEILLKMYAYGPKKYFCAFWNIFDFTVITAAWVVTIMSAALHKNEITILDVLMVLRILRLIRLAASLERFKIVLVTVVNIGPSIATYGTVIFVVFYIYAVIGMEVFHNRVQYRGYDPANESSLYCGNPMLNGSEFAAKRYCSNNFNNIAHAMFLLFDLLVVNQWHILAQGFVLVTHKAARLYFITFHITCVVVLLNIFTAFVLEAFILEYTLSKSHLESIVETRIKELGLGVGQNPKLNFYKKSDRQQLVDNMEPPEGSTEDHNNQDVTQTDQSVKHDDQSAADHGLRFCLKKNRSKRLETLLQLMFESELDVKQPDPSSKAGNNNPSKPAAVEDLDSIL